MEFLSMKDVLDFALSKEMASVQFYRDISSRIQQSSTRALFDVLLKNESEHVETIRLEIEKLGYTVDSNVAEEPSGYQWKEQLETEDSVGEMSFAEALMLAIQKERAAFRLYTQLLGQNQSPEYEQILLELAEEEMRHVLQLEREYQSIMRPGNP